MYQGAVLTRAFCTATATGWSPINGLGLHTLQLQILRQGLARLKVGGRLVYSTCSLNPHENEAVVAAALTTAAADGGGGVELVDCGKELPGLRRLPGQRTWRVLLPNGAAGEPSAKSEAGATGGGEQQWYSSYAEVPGSLASSLSLPPTVFPPPPDVAATLGLEKVWRLLPHHQDTGGFFVCVFRRTAAPASGGSGGIRRPIGLAKPSRKLRKKAKKQAAAETGAVVGGTGWSPLGVVEAAAVRSAVEFLALDGTAAGRAVFAGGNDGQLLRRGERVHLLTDAAAALATDRAGLQLVSAGSAVLEPGVGSRSSLADGEEEHAGGGYVVPQAALALAMRWMGADGSGRVVTLSARGARALLQAKRSGTHGGRLRCAVDDDDEDEEQGAEGVDAAAVCAMPAGGCIALFAAEGEEGDPGGTVALSCWKSDPCWLQVSNGSDKAALAAAAAQMDLLDPPTQAE